MFTVATLMHLDERLESSGHFTFVADFVIFDDARSQTLKTKIKE